MQRNLVVIILFTLLVSSCSLMPSPKPVAVDKYLLEYTPSGNGTAPAANATVVMISIPQSHGAYDTSRIAYMQQQYGLRYYTRSRWADTPARMLAPLLAEAMNASGEFQSLYASPGRVAADLRLDSELIRFHQDFTGQAVVMHLTVRIQLVDLREQRVLGSRLIDIREPATSGDAYGAVQAANRAVQQLLGQVVEFCSSLAH